MIRESTLSQEGSCPQSMWLSQAFFLPPNEFKELIDLLLPFYMVKTDSVLAAEEGLFNKEDFLKAYEHYFTAVTSNQPLNDDEVRFFFQCVWTISLDTLYRIKLSEEKHIIKLSMPSIMVQHHRLHYSKDDKTFRSMVFGKDTFPFGLQLSYPQLYQDPKSCNLEKVLLSDKFINSKLFTKARQWFRDKTRPMSVLLENKKVTIPVRISKSSSEYLHHIQALTQNHITVL